MRSPSSHWLHTYDLEVTSEAQPFSHPRNYCNLFIHLYFKFCRCSGAKRFINPEYDFKWKRFANK
jgi:hypothetical protein